MARSKTTTQANESERFDVLDAGPSFGGYYLWIEARAGTARYAALPPGALTGHTADDQAETVLLNLLRGAALAVTRAALASAALFVLRVALAAALVLTFLHPSLQALHPAAGAAIWCALVVWAALALRDARNATRA